MQRSIEDALLRMGELAVEFGNSEEALGYFKRRYEMTKADLASQPDNALFKERLAMASLSLGQLSTEVRRDLKKSLEYYQEALALRKQVAQLSKSEIDRQNANLKPDERLQPLAIKLNLSEGYTRVGLTNFFLGEPAPAEAPLLGSLALREELLAALSSEVGWSLIPRQSRPETLLAIASKQQQGTKSAYRSKSLEKLSPDRRDL